MCRNGLAPDSRCLLVSRWFGLALVECSIQIAGGLCVPSGGEGFPTSHKIQEGFTLVVTVELELMTGSE